MLCDDIYQKLVKTVHKSIERKEGVNELKVVL